MKGVLKWGQRVEVARRQSAWYDHTTYVVPVDGTVDTSAIHTALRKKFWNPGLSGSSVGGYMSPSTITDNGDGTVMVALLYHIGD